MIEPRVPPEHARIASTIWWVLAGVAGLIAVAVSVFDLPRELLGLLILALMLVLIMLGVPVAIAMASAATYGVFLSVGFRGLAFTLQEFPFRSSASWSLSVIPMFILMGFVVFRSGLSAQIYDAARAWLGGLPGGIAIATNFAGAGMAAASGSSIGISYALGHIAIPEMLRSGYDKRLATAVVAEAGTIGQLIPPSILAVVYAGIAGTPIGTQLLAGLVPGILLAFSYAIIILVWVQLRPIKSAANVQTSYTWPDRWRAAGRVWPLVLIIVAVVGGLYGGIFTATEAGAFGALAAIILSWITGGKDFGAKMLAALRDTVYATTAIMFLLVSVSFLNRLLAVTNVAAWIAQRVGGLQLEALGFIGLMVVLYLILGMFMDPVGMMLLTVPVFSPTLQALNIDMIWFGVFIVMMGEIAITSPPVGVQSFIIHQLCQEPGLLPEGEEIRLWDVFSGVLRFGIGDVAVVAILIAFPGVIYIFL